MNHNPSSKKNQEIHEKEVTPLSLLPAGNSVSPKVQVNKTKKEPANGSKIWKIP